MLAQSALCTVAALGPVLHIADTLTALLFDSSNLSIACRYCCLVPRCDSGHDATHDDLEGGKLGGQLHTVTRSYPDADPLTQELLLVVL